MSDFQKEKIGFAIFGVTGDLTKRKLIPALYQLTENNNLSKKIKIIGFARRPWTDNDMKNQLSKGIEDFSRTQPINKGKVQNLLSESIYIESSFENPLGYKILEEKIEKCNLKGLIFYLAAPPDSYIDIIHNLGMLELEGENKVWSRIVVEKPYGSDVDSAEVLEKELHVFFKENQIFRIDHYLGKETVQNILVFRFANGIFEPLWNNHYIDHVQITVAETVGVGTRAGYFDNAGIIRDMFANHLLQLLALTAMESPYAFNASSVRDEKMKVLKALRPMKNEKAIANTVRAQYSASRVGQEEILGYKQEFRVNPNSNTETYLAVKIFVDNWRWSGVPFYIRCGKRLPIRATEIAIHFKQVPLSLFDWKNLAGDAPNVLSLRLQPDEGINLTFGAKMPGPINQISPVSMEFCYEDAFGAQPPEAYERLLLDVINGDATLFTRSDEANAQWQFTTDIINAWNETKTIELPQYPAGTWGPIEAEEFIQKDHRTWRNPK